LAVHNPEINWKKGEVKMTKCSLLCGKSVKIQKNKEVREEKQKIVKWIVDEKKGWKREKEIEVDHRKVEKMVYKRFYKWLKVFKKVEIM